jgi:hypothetical protein
MEAPRTETKVYAEHERLSLIKDKSQAIGEFLDWLQNERKLVICRWYPDEFIKGERIAGTWELARIPIHTLLAEYFGIDEDKLEREKREILVDIRKQYAAKQIDKELGL